MNKTEIIFISRNQYIYGIYHPRKVSQQRQHQIYPELNLHCPQKQKIT